MLTLGLGPPNPLVAPLSGTLEGAKFRGSFECRRPSENSAIHDEPIVFIQDATMSLYGNPKDSDVKLATDNWGIPNI